MRPHQQTGPDIYERVLPSKQFENAVNFSAARRGTDGKLGLLSLAGDKIRCNYRCGELS